MSDMTSDNGALLVLVLEVEDASNDDMVTFSDTADNLSRTGWTD